MKSTVASLLAVIVVTMIIFMASPANAVKAYYPGDDQVALGIDPDVAFPLGNFSDVANAGFGINGNFQYRINPRWDLLLNLGYLHWGGKSNIVGFDYSYSAVPFQGGAKYYFRTASLDSPRFYVGGLIGFHDMSLRIPRFDDAGRFLFSTSSSETEFSLAPLGGFEYGIARDVNLDVSARYQYVANDFSYFGLRAGLNFLIR